jgi:hypothetical protein
VVAKARFFLTQARINQDVDRFAYTSNIEAAIVFARSVTLHLQKDFAHSEGFKEWYAERQHALSQDPLSRFLLQERNFILKVRALSTKRIVEAEFMASVHATATVNVRVIRAKPWYRRHPKILYDDLTYPLRNWASGICARRQASRTMQTIPVSTGHVVSDHIFFDHPDWSRVPALDLLVRHLDRLEPIVRDAEAAFGPSAEPPSESSAA